MRVVILLTKKLSDQLRKLVLFFVEIIVCWQNVLIWWNKSQNMEKFICRRV
jgi:hypothetical protein